MATNASRANSRFSIGITSIGILGGALLALAAPATAATCTWTGAGGDALWSHSTNWSGCTKPANGDVLIYPAGAPAISTNDIADLTINRISITGVAQGASYTIGGLGITIADQLISSGGIGPDGLLPTLALPIKLNAGNSVVVNVSQTGYLTIAGVITETGSASLVKLGVGTLALDNVANAWSRLAIENGFVQQQVAGAIPANLRVEMTSPSAFLLLNNIDTTIRDLISPHFPPAGSGFGQVSVGLRTLTITGTCDFSGQIFGAHIVKTGPSAGLLDSPFGRFFTGTITVNEGTLTVTNSNAEAPVIGAIVVNGGTFVAGQSGVLPGTATVTVNSPGVFALDALADTTIGSLTGDGSVSLIAATLTVGGDNSSSTFPGTIGGSGSSGGNVALTKAGTGTLTLTGTSHTFQGYTRVNEGTLIVNGSLPTGGINDVEVFGGTFAGTGSVGAIYMPSAGPKVSPGTSPGILHVTSAYMRGTYAVELNGSVPGSGYDQLQASSGDVDIAGATLQVSRGFAPPAGTLFEIIKLASLSPGQVIGTFAGLPEGAELSLGGQRFRISYRTAIGRGVSLVALDAPPVLTIDDVTVTEDESGTTDAMFTVSLSRPLDEAITVQYTTANGTATAPGDYAGTSGSLVFLPGMTTRTIIVPVIGDRDVEPDETFLVTLFGLAGSGGREIAALARTQGVGTIATDDFARTYFLSEGATGSFFDEDILIANANDAVAPVTLTFLKETGEQVTATRTIGPRSHVTVHADLVPGLEAGTASVQVTSEAGVPLMVERTMFWDKAYYAGHTGSSVDRPATDWLFAEGSQGFFDTFVLVANPQATATDVTFTFLPEDGGPIVVTRTLGPTSRLTLYAGDVAELANRSFGVTVHASQPIMAERSMYFGSTPERLWSGGTESAGVTSAATRWFLAEGATGGFFDTFILLSNPQDAPANVTVTYLLDAGTPVAVQKVVPAHGRLTINLEAEDDARLHAAAVSTVVTADVPIVAERSMYWAAPWHEAHNSFGLVDLGTRWGLAEGRVGGPLDFHTYILLANPQTTAATVTVTYLREEGAPLVRQYTVPPTSRFNIDVNAIVPEMHDESFGTLIEVTNGVAIAAERSMYWNAQGLFWSGGTNATGTRLEP